MQTINFDGMAEQLGPEKFAELVNTLEKASIAACTSMESLIQAFRGLGNIFMDQVQIYTKFEADRLNEAAIAGHNAAVNMNKYSGDDLVTLLNRLKVNFIESEEFPAKNKTYTRQTKKSIKNSNYYQKMKVR
jgi:hypothetical protein